MSDQSRKLLRLATTTPKKFIDVELFYIKGRGYWLAAKDIEIDDGCVRYQLRFDGVGRKQVEEAPRFNRRRLDALADLHTTSLECQILIATVLSARGLELVPQSEQDACLAAVS